MLKGIIIGEVPVILDLLESLGGYYREWARIRLGLGIPAQFWLFRVW